jgi:ribosome-binding factor A
MVLKEEIATIVSMEMKDPSLSVVTITHVKVARDMRGATVYYSVYGTHGEQEKAGIVLSRASGYIRGELGRRLKLKRVPELYFEFDDSFEKGMHINRLLKEIEGDD